MFEFSTIISSALRALLLFLPIPLFYQWFRARSKFTAVVDKMPGPVALPLLGNALDLLMTPVELFQHAVDDLLVYGRVHRVWVLTHAQIIISGAKDAEVIMQGMTHHTKSINYRFLDNWMGQGLLTSSDEKWRFHRKILTPAFHFSILPEFVSIFNKHSLRLVERLAAESKAKTKAGFNIFPYSSLCTLDIICESSMGKQLNAQYDEKSPYVMSVISMNDLLVHRYFSAWLRPEILFFFSPTKRAMDRNLRIINDFTDKVINDRRQYLKSSNFFDGKEISEQDIGQRRNLAFIDLLLASEARGEKQMTQKDIRDQVSTFMFEGHDTVSTAISWSLFMLGTHPEIQAKVVEELENVFGESGRTPDMADLANLKYLERCVKETLRLYPSVAFFERQTKVEAKLERYTVPPGCTVSINAYNVHRDPEYFPDPEKFDPDRFLPENSKNRHPFSYIPFSAGPRNCIGQKFALLEEKAVLSTVLRHFRVEAAHTREQAQLQIGMVLRPKNGLRVRMFPRDSHPKLRIIK